MNFNKEKLSLKWGGWSITAVCFLLSYGHAYAEPLTLDTALKLAEQYAPTLRANSARIEGAENVVSASGILPNPKLFFGLENYPISGDASWSVTQDGMTMQKIGVMQDFPNRAKRQAEVELAKAELGSATAQTEILRIELRRVQAPINTANIVIKQQHIQGLVVGNREQQNQFVNALENYSFYPIISNIFKFKDLERAFEFQKNGEHFGKICVEY